MSNLPLDNDIVTTVNENDEDDETTEAAKVNTNSENSEEAAHTNKLRIAAEKRRQKILQQANTRMSIVEGTFNSTEVAPTSTDTPNNDETIDANSVATDDAITDASVVPNEHVAASTDEPATSSSSTTSSKLAAMRRRRFQKKSGPIKETNEETSIAVSTETQTTSVEIDDTNKAAVLIGEEVISPGGKIDTSTTMSDSITEQESVGIEQTQVADNDTTNNPAAPKKYLGVARMRRRMNKEKQDQQDNELDDHTKPTASSTNSTSSSIGAVPKKKRLLITSLPIFMYAITTAALFLTGLNIGLQQSQGNYCYSNSIVTDDTTNGYCYNTSNQQQWSIVIHSELAPRKSGGLQRVLSTMNIGQTSNSSPVKKPIGMHPELDKSVELEHDVDDEFAAKEFENKVKDKNIDPLFQVDLDELTAGDGIYFTLARFAVHIHRLILSVVYYTPKAILGSILSFIMSFVQTPPILFIMAVLIRHGLGKFILGAKLPSIVVDETQHKDILSTIKTFVSKFILSSFPTLKIVYDVWSHIRSDMYVMLCGLFFGIALSHYHQAGSPYGEIPTMTTSETTGNMADSIADEL